MTITGVGLLGVCRQTSEDIGRTPRAGVTPASSLYLQLLVTSELTSVLIAARRQTASSSM
jgi:hypothetical protein